MAKKLPPLKVNKTPSPKGDTMNPFSFNSATGEGTQVRKISMQNPFEGFDDVATVDLKGNVAGLEGEGKTVDERPLRVKMKGSPKLRVDPK